MENTNEQLARGMRMLALATFLIGTAIFVASYFIGGKVILVGYAYVVVAFIVNGCLALVGIGEAIRNRDRKLFMSIGLMLLNIPVMALYVWLVFRWTNVQI